MFKTDPPSTLYIADAALNVVHVNNNVHEHHNRSVAQFIARARGFRSDELGLFALCSICHNFLRPHMGLNGMTPAEKYGIKIPSSNKLRTLMRCAATSKFKFSCRDLQVQVLLTQYLEQD